MPMKYRSSPISAPLATLLLFALSACSKPADVSITKIGRHTVESTVVGVNSGTVKAEQSAELAFGAVGRVSALYVRLGDRVKKGTLLAEIENSDMKTALTRAHSELKRRETMGSQVVSKSDFDTAKLGVDSAQVQLDRTLIRAPYDGMISEVNLEVGQLSQITAVIPKPPLRITDIIPRYVRVDIDEVDLPRVKPGLPARVKIPAVRREPFAATVRKVVPFINSVREQDRTSELELTVEAGEALLPAGASADVEIVVESRENVLSLPSRAVFGRENSRFIYSIKESKVVKVPVTVGIWNYDFTEILSGANEGTVSILPSDIVELKEGLAVQAKTDGR